MPASVMGLGMTIADSWRGVVKVQRSLFDSEGGPQRVLIYNKSRTLMHEQELPADVRAMFVGDEPKFYANASYAKNELVIDSRAPAQAW